MLEQLDLWKLINSRTIIIKAAAWGRWGKGGERGAGGGGCGGGAVVVLNVTRP